MKAILDLAIPELYERNAFRLLEVPVEATERDLAKRQQTMEVAARNKLAVPPGPGRLMPRTPPPDEHEIREAAQAIQDAERRLAHEFFWFWPLAPGGATNDPALRLLQTGQIAQAEARWRGSERTPDEAPAAKHNLALLHHFSALALEQSLLNGKAAGSPVGDESARVAEAERYWVEAYRYWGLTTADQSCWSRVVARIRALEDPSLTTGAARRMEGRLPVTLVLINARLAIRALQNQKPAHAQRHVARIRASGLPTAAVDEALRSAIEPARSAIKTLCETAKREADADPIKADKITERLLEQSAPHLALLALLLPEAHPSRDAEFDQVALAAQSCAIDYGNKTENWALTVSFFNRFAPLAASTAAKERIAKNQKTVQENYQDSLCWFCGTNPADPKCVQEVPMHGDVQRIPIPNGVRTTWRHLKVQVPRCSACQSATTRQNNRNLGRFFGCVGGLGLWLFCGVNDYPVLGFSLGLALIVGVFVLAHKHAKKHEQPGVKRRATNDYTRIKNLLSEGWKFGDKPQ